MSTVSTMADARFVLKVKSVKLETTKTPSPDLVPAETLTFERLAGARAMAARMLLNARERGWEVFRMNTTDPYHWCLITDEVVHFMTIEAQTEPTT